MSFARIAENNSHGGDGLPGGLHVSHGNRNPFRAYPHRIGGIFLVRANPDLPIGTLACCTDVELRVGGVARPQSTQGCLDEGSVLRRKVLERLVGFKLYLNVLHRGIILGGKLRKKAGQASYICTMRAEIITIGTEILLGQTTDSNSAWLGQHMDASGVRVERITSIADKPESIIAALNAVPSTIDWVVITGGLGPTRDDLTKHVLCTYFEDHLIFRPEIYAHIESLFASMGRVPNALNRPQAELPAKAEIIPNAVGTAQGMLWTRGCQRILAMPGVPYEMKHIMETGILPRMRAERNELMVHKYFVVQGISESDLALRLASWESTLVPPVSLAYLPSPGLVKLRLSIVGPAQKERELQAEIGHVATELLAILGDDVYTDTLTPLEELVGQQLKALGHRVGTAESCTGGAIAARIASVPGSSAYFQGSVVAYANEVKQGLLGVNLADLLIHGAVSEPVVKQMASGLRKQLKVDWAIATSGVAGPEGGSEAKPVGTVWVAVVGPSYVWTRCFQMGLDRGRVIQKTVLSSLDALRRGLLAHEGAK